MQRMRGRAASASFLSDAISNPVNESRCLWVLLSCAGPMAPSGQPPPQSLHGHVPPQHEWGQKKSYREGKYSNGGVPTLDGALSSLV